MNCRIVHLDSRPDRMRDIQKEMDKLFIDYEIFYAVNGWAPGTPGITNGTLVTIDAIVGIDSTQVSNPTFGQFFTISAAQSLISGSNSAILHLNAGDTIGLYLKSSFSSGTPTSPLLLNQPTVYLNAVLLRTV